MRKEQLVAESSMMLYTWKWNVKFLFCERIEPIYEILFDIRKTKLDIVALFS